MFVCSFPFLPPFLPFSSANAMSTETAEGKHPEIFWHETIDKLMFRLEFSHSPEEVPLVEFDEKELTIHALIDPSVKLPPKVPGFYSCKHRFLNEVVPKPKNFIVRAGIGRNSYRFEVEKKVHGTPSAENDEDEPDGAWDGRWNRPFKDKKHPLVKGDIVLFRPKEHLDKAERDKYEELESVDEWFKKDVAKEIIKNNAKTDAEFMKKKNALDLKGGDEDFKDFTPEQFDNLQQYFREKHNAGKKRDFDAARQILGDDV